MLVGNRIPTFRGNVPSCSMVKKRSKKNEEGSDYPLTLRYIPEDTAPVNTVDSDGRQPVTSHRAQHPLHRTHVCGPLAGRTWDILQDGHLSTELCDIRPPSKHRSLSRNRRHEAFFESENAILRCLFVPVANPGILFGWVQQIQLRKEDRENGDLGAVAP